MSIFAIVHEPLSSPMKFPSQVEARPQFYSDQFYALEGFLL